jgi:hypothetical protein
MRTCHCREPAYEQNQLRVSMCSSRAYKWKINLGNSDKCKELFLVVKVHIIQLIFLLLVKQMKSESSQYTEPTQDSYLIHGRSENIFCYFWCLPRSRSLLFPSAPFQSILSNHHTLRCCIVEVKLRPTISRPVRLRVELQIFVSCLTIVGFLPWGALSDERLGL